MSRHNSISQDENYHHLSYGQQQAIEEPRAFRPPNVSPRMLHPAAHPPQQNAVMVDIHDQVKIFRVQTEGCSRCGVWFWGSFPTSPRSLSSLNSSPHLIVDSESHRALNSIWLLIE